MLKSKFSVLAKMLSVAFLVYFFVFVGCTPDGNPDIEALVGTWVSELGEQFVISENSLENYYSDNLCYAMNELIVEKTDSTSGIIYGKYTSNVIDNGVVGKWYAVSYKNLTSGSIELSGAYKKDGVSATDTLEEAKEEFTIDNKYFGIYSECVKK